VALVKGSATQLLKASPQLPPYQATLNVPGEVAVWAKVGDQVIAIATRTTNICLMQMRFMTFPFPVA
jgi:hypothetical protein